MSEAFHHVLSRLNQLANGPQEGRKTDMRTVRLDDLRQLLDDWNRLDDDYRLAHKTIEGNLEMLRRANKQITRLMGEVRELKRKPK